MGIFDKFFSKKEKPGLTSDKRLGSSDERKKFFADTSYLHDNQQPEAVIVIPQKDVIESLDSKKGGVFLEENAFMLKNLTRDYNIRIALCTFYSEGHSADRVASNHRLCIASGVSEAYYRPHIESENNPDGSWSSGNPLFMMKMAVREKGLEPVKDPFRKEDRVSGALDEKPNVFHKLCSDFKIDKNHLLYIMPDALNYTNLHDYYKFNNGFMRVDDLDNYIRKTSDLQRKLV